MVCGDNARLYTILMIMALHQRRPGTGAIFFAPSAGLWIGQREIPTPRGEKRRTRRVTSATFCAMLEKFSAIPELAIISPRAPVLPVRSRRENLVAAILRGTHTDAEWYAKQREQDGLCYYCGEKSCDTQPTMVMGKLRYHLRPLEKDHKIPISRGGSDSIDNIVGACVRCNREKATMTADEYMELRRGR